MYMEFRMTNKVQTYKISISRKIEPSAGIEPATY